MVGISATREGNKLKEIVGPIISLMPNFVRNFLISMELKSNTHDKNTERKIHFHESLEKLKGQSFDRILVVDDSVDTGHSMKQVVDAIQNEFKTAEIKIAGLNVWDKSKNIIHTDFALYENTVIKAPMSKDSSEYKEFVRIYNEETENEVEYSLIYEGTASITENTTAREVFEPLEIDVPLLVHLCAINKFLGVLLF